MNRLILVLPRIVGPGSGAPFSGSGYNVDNPLPESRIRYPTA
jgi:hypothetical protein